MQDFTEIAKNDDDVFITVGDDDDVYMTTGDVLDFVGITASTFFNNISYYHKQFG